MFAQTQFVVAAMSIPVLLQLQASLTIDYISSTQLARLHTYQYTIDPDHTITDEARRHRFETIESITRSEEHNYLEKTRWLRNMVFFAHGISPGFPILVECPTTSELETMSKRQWEKRVQDWRNSRFRCNWNIDAYGWVGRPCRQIYRGGAKRMRMISCPLIKIDVVQGTEIQGQRSSLI